MRLVDLVEQLRTGHSDRVEGDWRSLVASLPDNLPCSRHPLGFLHIELTSLIEGRPGERMRLHYWPGVGVNADQLGTLHDHVWSLASVVAAGQLHDRTYTVTPVSDGPYSATRIAYGHDQNRFRHDGRFDIQIARDLRVGPGQVYRIPSRTIHESEVIQAPAVTFVHAQDDPRADALGPLVFSINDLCSVGTPVREPFDCSVAISLVLARLASEATS